MNRWAIAAVALLVALVPLAAACGDDEQASASGSASPVAATADIVGTLSADEQFSKLVTAVTTAGLEETLQDDGPFTVFAPTDDAFAALPAGALDELLADPSGALTDTLLYHVAPGEAVAASELSAGAKLASALEGEELVVYSGSDGKLYVNDIEIVQKDIPATNGVIHAIDTVIALD